MVSKKMEKFVILTITTNLTQREIAEELAVNESTISRWKRTDEYKTIAKEIQKEYLHDLTAPAVRTMKKLLSAKSELVRFNTAKDILDRTGHKPTDKVELDADVDMELNIKIDYGDDG